MKQKVPFVDLKAQYLSIQNEIDAALKNVINETAFIGGKYVKAFEKEFAEQYGVDHVIACANGTDSLYIIMKMLGIGAGDEVITVANSWISSSETITQTGATPVFVDIDPSYYSINEQLLQAAITPRTKAVIAVHLQGQMCAIDTIKTICDQHGIALIEDCAQSHFSAYKNIQAGLTGIAGSFSFYPGKNLGAYGDAGCIITNNEELATKCRMYANHGALVKHQHQMEGINSRMDGLQASVLSAKLPYIKEWTAKRIEVASWYNEALKNNKAIELPALRPNSKHSYHLYVLLAEYRDELLQYLKEQGVEAAIHYPTILPLLPAYNYLGYTAADFPVAYDYQQKIISLPIYPELTKGQVQYVADTISAFYSDKK
jgi:dTDP-4-amino-4,6-dideoxygalactose transaminase